MVFSTCSVESCEETGPAGSLVRPAAGHEQQFRHQRFALARGCQCFRYLLRKKEVSQTSGLPICCRALSFQTSLFAACCRVGHCWTRLIVSSTFGVESCEVTRPAGGFVENSAAGHLNKNTSKVHGVQQLQCTETRHTNGDDNDCL